MPKNASIQNVGGSDKEFWIESTARNYYTEKQNGAEAGAWRVEISPSQPALSDVFLNVIAVMDAATNAGPQVSLIANDSIAAVKVLDRAVVFSKENALLTNFGLSIDGTQNVKLLVCDAAQGTWSVKKQNAVYETAVATGGAHTLYVNCTPGTYRFEQTGSGIVRRGSGRGRMLHFENAIVYDARGRQIAGIGKPDSRHYRAHKLGRGVFIIGCSGATEVRTYAVFEK